MQFLTTSHFLPLLTLTSLFSISLALQLTTEYDYPFPPPKRALTEDGETPILPNKRCKPFQKDILLSSGLDAAFMAGMAESVFRNWKVGSPTPRLVYKYFGHLNQPLTPGATSTTRDLVEYIFSSLRLFFPHRLPSYIFSCGDFHPSDLSTFPEKRWSPNELFKECVDDGSSGPDIYCPTKVTTNPTEGKRMIIPWNDMVVCPGFFEEGRMYSFWEKRGKKKPEPWFCYEEDAEMKAEEVAEERKMLFRGFTMLRELIYTRVISNGYLKVPDPDWYSYPPCPYDERCATSLSDSQKFLSADNYALFAWEASHHRLCGRLPKSLTPLPSVPASALKSKSPGGRRIRKREASKTATKQSPITGENKQTSRVGAGKTTGTGEIKKTPTGKQEKPAAEYINFREELDKRSKQEYEQVPCPDGVVVNKECVQLPPYIAADDTKKTKQKAEKGGRKGGSEKESKSAGSDDKKTMGKETVGKETVGKKTVGKKTVGKKTVGKKKSSKNGASTSGTTKTSKKGTTDRKI